MPSEKTRTPWGDRILTALGGKPLAWLAREADINPSSLRDMVSKVMPSAEAAIRIAKALDVPVEWLITGAEDRQAPRLIAADEADWIMVPRYRLADFTAEGKPEPIEMVPLRRDWLNKNARASTGLWLAELPATSLEGIGEEGDTILLRDAAHHHEEGVYLYFYEGAPVVRRFVFPHRVAGLGDPSRSWVVEFEDNPAMRLAGRILGTIKLRPV